MTGYTEILAYKPDVIVAGAGFSGLVAARIFAENSRRVLVLEKRTHLGGNAYGNGTYRSSVRAAHFPYQ